MLTEAPANTRSLIVTGLTNGTAYTFRVRANNDAGPGPFSAATAPVTPAPSAPGQPTGVEAEAGNAAATVRWTAPASDGGTPIIRYEIQVLDPDTFDVIGALRTAPADARELTVTGLTNGSPYWFRVRAVNASGTGVFSDGSSTVTPTAPATAPDAPVIGTATAGSGSAVVRWTEPASDGGSAITAYEIQVVNSATGATFGAVRIAAADATQLTVTGLVNGTAYRFRVRARNDVGTSALSATSNAVTPGAAPGTVASLTATRGANGGVLTVAVQWIAPATLGGSAITGYRITRQRLNNNGSNNGAAVVTTVSAASRSLTFTAPAGVARDTRYRFTVQAVNGVGTGAARAVIGAVR